MLLKDISDLFTSIIIFSDYFFMFAFIFNMKYQLKILALNEHYGQEDISKLSQTI